jgi:hypothetical protein
MTNCVHALPIFYEFFLKSELPNLNFFASFDVICLMNQLHLSSL